MSARAPLDPGLRAAVPFTFQCQRSGHCCTHGEGYVWVEPGEVATLAAAKGMDETAFRARHVRTVLDPLRGELRLSLTESAELPPGNGRCSLLEGTNHCGVYDARPTHCRTFPYWDSVMGGGEGFERARAVCPGIRPVTEDEQRARAFRALEELYREVDALVERSRAVCLVRGLCCRFEEAGHLLYATALEADYAASVRPDAPPPAAPGRCPYHVGGRCTAREARPLGCRTYFCDAGPEEALQEAHEFFLRRIRAIEQEFGLPAGYAPFPAQLAARGVGQVASREVAP